MSENPDPNMNISVRSWVHILKDTWNLDAKGLSDCVEGSRRDWNHARKYPRLAWAGWRRPGFQLLAEEEIAVVILCLFIFISATSVIKFYIFFLFCLLELSFASLIRMTTRPKLIGISEGLLYTVSEMLHDLLTSSASTGRQVDGSKCGLKGEGGCSP
jgi:hypothetical protein